MTARTSIAIMSTLTLMLVSGIVARASQSTAAAQGSGPDPERVKRGAYLVTTMGCHDCHTPLKMGANGPEPDMSRALTGHPQDLKITEAPKTPEGPWMMVAAHTMTAFSGPWGVSFTANLTPDKETGLGSWTPEMFIATMRTGRHQGKGRQILPPMPAQVYAKATDEDLRSIFAYLQSLAPVNNRVPAPLDPPDPASVR